MKIIYQDDSRLYIYKSSNVLSDIKENLKIFKAHGIDIEKLDIGTLFEINRYGDFFKIKNLVACNIHDIETNSPWNYIQKQLNTKSRQNNYTKKSYSRALLVVNPVKASGFLDDYNRISSYLDDGLDSYNSFLKNGNREKGGLRDAHKLIVFNQKKDCLGVLNMWRLTNNAGYIPSSALFDINYRHFDVVLSHLVANHQKGLVDSHYSYRISAQVLDIEDNIIYLSTNSQTNKFRLCLGSESLDYFDSYAQNVLEYILSTMKFLFVPQNIDKSHGLESLLCPLGYIYKDGGVSYRNKQEYPYTVISRLLVKDKFCHVLEDEIRLSNPNFYEILKTDI